MNEAHQTIVTLKWGELYSGDYVNRLYHAVRRHWPESNPFPRFVCFTDDESGIIDEVDCHPIPEIDVPHPKILTGWRKLCLFRDDLPLEGDCLFLDLDVVVVGDISKFFDYEKGKIPIIHNWVHWRKALFKGRPEVGNSSVFRWQANAHRHVVDQYESEKDYALENFQPPQTYLTHCIREHMCYWPEEWVRSFKFHCRPSFPFNYLKSPPLPPEASIIAFHGRPNPDEAMDGYKEGKIHHKTLAAPWIRKHWLGE